MTSQTSETAVANNLLFFGDNLDVLRQHVKDESVDLVYLDPPFNSKADYNVLFAEHDGRQAASQIKAFHDTWHWDQAASKAYEEFTVTAPHAASQALQAFRGAARLQRHAGLSFDDGPEACRVESGLETDWKSLPSLRPNGKSLS